jgi:pilus assembly protein CpaF
MNKIFRIILRYSPSVVMVGEIRGMGEAIEGIKACTRGHHGSMATIHFGSPEEAIEGSGKMMLEEGLSLPLSVAKTWVASAFNIVIQMFFDDSKRGIKKITQITEVWPEEEHVRYRDLVVWQSHPDDFFKGSWVWLNHPSERLIKKLRQFGITSEDLREAGVVL